MKAATAKSPGAGDDDALDVQKPSYQAKPYYGFSLSDPVPQQHLLRSVHRMIDRQGIWRLAGPFNSRTGAPSAGPVVVLKEEQAVTANSSG